MPYPRPVDHVEVLLDVIGAYVVDRPAPPPDSIAEWTLSG